MRAITPLLLLLLSGLLPGCALAVGAIAGTEAASVAVFGRGIVDGGISAATGQDCSIVRLDRRQPYCAPRERLSLAPPFCTRTLGSVMCWSNPEAFVNPPHQLADAPPLTAEQARLVGAPWPKLLSVDD